MALYRNARESMAAFEEMQRRLVRLIVGVAVTLAWVVVLL